MDNMHSHRLEADAILSVLLFFKEYFNFYSILLQNKFKIYCDNKVIVNKINMVKTANYYDFDYTMSEHKEIMAINLTFLNVMKYFIFTATRQYN